jgi:endonuclease/exonuclease/phosphatase family metal-dependent hydrolase
MNLISWNCRGLGNHGAVRDLCQMEKEKRPTLLFLMETKSRHYKFEHISVKLGFDGLFVVDPVGQSGGLALLWKESGNVEILNFTRRHIHAVVTESEGGAKWSLTCFYGHLITARRFESWELLHHLKTFSPGAWMCIGDFNEIVEQDEKVGGALRRDGQMEQFQNVLEYCGLSDLGFKGSKFTWSNGHHDGSFMKEHLDRAVVNHAWCELFMRREILVLPTRTSDHSPLFVRIFDAH